MKLQQLRSISEGLMEGQNVRVGGETPPFVGDKSTCDGECS